MKTIYADTSIFGGCFEKEFSEWSNKLLEEFKKGRKRMMISEIVHFELAKASKKVKEMPFMVPNLFSIQASTSLLARRLAEKYIIEGALTDKSYYDALHIANATLQGADMLASWNFKHMANLKKIKHYNVINKNIGYRPIDIRTPREILNP